VTARAVVSIVRRVAFAETDASGRIHFTAPLRWAEEAEHLLLLRGGLRDVTCFPRVEVRSQYLLPLGFGDEVTVELAVLHVGRTSIGYEWRGRRRAETCFQGRHTVVHVDAQGSPRALPEALGELLTDENRGPITQYVYRDLDARYKASIISNENSEERAP